MISRCTYKISFWRKKLIALCQPQIAFCIELLSRIVNHEMWHELFSRRLFRWPESCCRRYWTRSDEMWRVNIEWNLIRRLVELPNEMEWKGAPQVNKKMEIRCWINCRQTGDWTDINPTTRAEGADIVLLLDKRNRSHRSEVFAFIVAVHYRSRRGRTNHELLFCVTRRKPHSVRKVNKKSTKRVTRNGNVMNGVCKVRKETRMDEE